MMLRSWCGWGKVGLGGMLLCKFSVTKLGMWGICAATNGIALKVKTSMTQSSMTNANGMTMMFVNKP